MTVWGRKVERKVGPTKTLTKTLSARTISTYRNRDSIEKFSHVADRSEVAENDHNLNIPRYVDTFEEEMPVDIDAVCRELESLEESIAGTGKVIAE